MSLYPWNCGVPFLPCGIAFMLNWVVSNIAFCVKPTVPQRSLSGFFYKILFRLSPELISDVETFAHTKKNKKTSTTSSQLALPIHLLVLTLYALLQSPLFFFLLRRYDAAWKNFHDFAITEVIPNVKHFKNPVWDVWVIRRYHFSKFNAHWFFWNIRETNLTRKFIYGRY